MHYRAAATKRWQMVTDILLVVLGMVGMVYTTVLTINSWISGHEIHEPGYCDQR